jgi:DNA invertase Pin-like site-specific DNA recombinase
MRDGTKDDSTVRCAIYTRKSTEEGLEQDFNSLDAQHEACGAYVLSQRHEGWTPLPDIYEDGGYSGGNMDRPGLKALLADVSADKIDVIVVYKVDRLTRSLADFAKIVEILDGKGASFVSVTQAFNTTTSMGRLTLNVLLSFAQFEREVTSERIRDKVAASKAKGMWMGGPPPLGYDVVDRKLVIIKRETETVRHIFRRYLELGSAVALVDELQSDGIRSKRRKSRSGKTYGGVRITRGALYAILRNRTYVGEVTHKGHIYPGQHQAILDREIFDAAAQLLKQKGVERSLGSGSPDPSLLAGLLWDENGRRMSPSTGGKGNLRYRYYFSRTEEVAATEPRWRVSAPDIEQQVIVLLSKQLKATQAEIIAAGNLSAADIQRIGNLVSVIFDQLNSGVGRTLRGLLLNIVSRVELQRDSLTVKVLLGRVDSAFGEDTRTASTPITSIVRTGQQVRLVIPPLQSAEGNKSPSLIKLVTRASAARDVLMASKASTFEDLAADIGYSTEHAADLLKIGFLSPDIITAILEGRQPASLTRTKLIRWSGMPLNWAQQRKVLGFAPL